MKNTTTVQIAAQLETALESLSAIANAESRIGAIAYFRLAEKVNDAITALRMEGLRDELSRSLPPVSGGCDDYEEISEEFLTAPDEWPSDYCPVVDGWIWQCLEPTPDSILASDEHALDEEYDRWLDHLAMESCESRWTDADQLVAFGHV